MATKKKAAAKPAAKKAADTSAHTPQTGMEPGPDADAAKQATEAQFAEADAKAEPDIEALQVGLQVRGY